jgi:hypothetical protein
MAPPMRMTVSGEGIAVGARVEGQAVEPDLIEKVPSLPSLASTRARRTSSGSNVVLTRMRLTLPFGVEEDQRRRVRELLRRFRPVEVEADRLGQLA